MTDVRQIIYGRKINVP